MIEGDYSPSPLSSMHLSRPAILLPLLAIALLGAGCGNDASPSRDTSTNPSNTGSDTPLGQNATIPTDFPSDVPRYANAQTKVATHDGQTYTLSQESSDPIDTVVKSLDQQLTSKGYRATMHLGNTGEALQITDYTNADAKAMVRIQATSSPTSQKTVVLIVRSVANP